MCIRDRARGNNTTGVTGVNWNIKMLNIKYDVSKGIEEADVIAGYAYVLQQRRLYNSTNGAKGAFIVASNASWGIDDGKATDAPVSYTHLIAEELAADPLVRKVYLGANFVLRKKMIE